MLSVSNHELANNPTCARCGAVMVPTSNPREGWRCMSCGGAETITVDPLDKETIRIMFPGVQGPSYELVTQSLAKECRRRQGVLELLRMAKRLKMDCPNDAEYNTYIRERIKELGGGL